MDASRRVMMPSMETSFLTIAEAIEQTGKSASTIRRIIRTIADDSNHADRDGIQPSVKEVTAYKKKGENFTWKIRADLLMRESASAQKKEKKSSSETSPDILSILNKELDLKNQQIEKQWEVIHALNDRLREGNILMGSLQKRLGPPADATPSETVVEAAPVNASMESSTKKRGLFGWRRGR
jgi:hypothetical protein